MSNLKRKEVGRYPCENTGCNRVFLTNMALYGHYGQSRCMRGGYDE